MAKEQGKVRFIRKNGKVIPIRDDGKGAGAGRATKSQKDTWKKREKLEDRHTDSFMKSAKHRSEARKISNRHSGAGRLVGLAAGAAAGTMFKKSPLLGVMVGGFLGSEVGASAAQAIGKRSKGYKEKRKQAKYEEKKMHGIRREYKKTGGSDEMLWDNDIFKRYHNRQSKNRTGV